MATILFSIKVRFSLREDGRRTDGMAYVTAHSLEEARNVWYEKSKYYDLSFEGVKAVDLKEGLGNNLLLKEEIT